MTRIAGTRLLAIAVLLVPHTGRAQTQAGQAPRATIRELATIDGYVDGFVRLPDGRTLIYSVDDSAFAFDISSKRRTLLGLDMIPSSVSPQGDRLAFGRRSEDRSGPRLWTVPIDPRTGNATGPAQLVSQRRIEGATHIRFSPDGRLIAFFGASARPATTWDLLVVPPVGGEERLIASYPRAKRVAWNTDGTALDVEVYDAGTAIERITLGSGNRRALFPITPATSTMGVGVSPDAQVAIYTMNPDRFFYRTTSGTEGEVEVLLPALDDGWGYDFSLDAQNRYLSATYVLKNQGVRLVDVQTRRIRTVLAGEPTSSPSWSRDSRRLAVLTGPLSHRDVAIMNADGSGLRRYPVPMLVVTAPRSGSDRPWSPDGRFLAFFAEAGPRFGYTPENQKQLVILDLTTGATRVLATSPDHFSGLEWRADSKSLQVVRNRDVPGQTRGHRTIVEVGLDGSEKLLRDVSADYPAQIDVTLNPNDVAIVGVRGKDNVERFLLPLGGGAARKLPDAGREGGIASSAVGHVTGNRTVLPIGDGTGAYPFMRVVSTIKDSMHTIRAPFGSVNGQVFADGRNAVLTGKAAGDSVHKLYLVSLDNGAQRLLGDIPGGTTGGRLMPSPDGKLVAFTYQGRYTSKIHEIDFAPAIQAITKR